MELNKENYDKNGAKHYPMNSYPGNRIIDARFEL